MMQAAVEYFRLLLPPWDASGGSNGWVKMKVTTQINVYVLQKVCRMLFAKLFRQGQVMLAPHYESIAVVF